MAKKKKNDSAKQAAKAQKRAKVASKADKTAKRQQKKAGIETEADLLETLENYRKEWENAHTVTVSVSAMPTKRANASLCPDPKDSSTLWLFGGESMIGDDCHFYNDLFRYNVDKKEWKLVASPNSPSPRSAHQLVGHASGQLWLFGGEFASLNQTVFHHFRDLWAFDLKEQSWERFETRIRPSARSGHRMVVWKQYIVLFGGFQDTGIRTTYLSDLWLFDLNEYRWQEIQQDVNAKPRARSGFSFLPCDEGVVLHGGYCKEYINKRAKGLPLEDTWLLRLDGLIGQGGGTIASSKTKWERRKKGGFAPSVRSGVTAALWPSKSTGVIFGGVHDEEDEDSFKSTFFDDMHGYQLKAPGRWRSLNVKQKKGQGGKRRRRPKPIVEAQPKSESEKDDSSSSDHNSNEDSDSEAEKERYMQPTVPQPEEEATKAPLEPPPDTAADAPCSRYNAMLAVQKNTLYLFGGILENNAQEATLDDFWAINLDKLDGWNCLHRSEIVWSQEANSDDEEGPSSSDSSGFSTEEEEEGVPEETVRAARKDVFLGFPQYVEAVDTGPSEAEKAELRKKADKFMAAAKAAEKTTDAERSDADKFSTPLPGDNLRLFYERGRDYFTRLAFSTDDSGKRGKELRRNGFQLAEAKFEAYRPILEEIERIKASADLDAAEGAGRAEGRDIANESRNRR